MYEEILYEKYKKIVNDFILYKYPGCIDIDDDVSEVLIKMFTNLTSFDSTKSKFKSWVLTITKNHIIDKWRNTNITINPCSYDNMFVTSDTFNALDYLESGICITNSNSKFENNSTISYLSSQLSKEDYTMLNMKYTEGYDYNEIGRQFNISSTTVSNRINYLKSKLKKENPELRYENY
jgi:RNA polymerase sigma-70 factor, ECF subfamily